MGKIAAIANQMRGNWQNWLLAFFINILIIIYLITNVIKSIKEKQIYDFVVNLGLVIIIILVDVIIIYAYLVDIGVY